MKWYDINKIDKDTYLIEENKHWHKFNIYYLIGSKYNLVIDCGIGLYKIKELLKEIDNKKVKLVVTHMHWDHIGNIDEFKEVYLSKRANYYFKNGIKMPIEKIRKLLLKDLDKELLPEDFEIRGYNVEKSERGKEIKEGETFRMGNRKVKVIETPGHTDDHISLYDQSKNYLFTGDLLYKGPLFLKAKYINLEDYFKSIKKLKKNYKEIEKILSSHKEPIIDKAYLDDIYNFLLDLKKEDKYHKGSGVHKKGKYKIYL